MDDVAAAVGPLIWETLEFYLNPKILRVLQWGITCHDAKPLTEGDVKNADLCYFMYLEAIFLLEHHIKDLRHSMRPGLMTGTAPDVQKRAENTKAAIKAIRTLIPLLEAALESRLAVTEIKPRVLRLCQRIGLKKPEEIKAFGFVVLVNAATELPTISGIRPTCALMANYSGMDMATYMHFLSEERPHFKQGLLGISDCRFKTNLAECTMKVPREVLAALTQAPMQEAELLKIDKTPLAEVLLEDGVHLGEVKKKEDDTEEVADESEEEIELEKDESGTGFDLYDFIREGKKSKPENEEAANDEEARDAEGPQAKKRKLTPNGTASEELLAANGKEVKPYTTDLEYLGETFKLLAVLIKIRNAEADIKDDDPEFFVQPKTEAEAQLRELKGKERVQRASIQKRLQKTKDTGKWMPRIEVLAQKRGFDNFEKNVILFLVGGIISHDVLIAMNGKYVMRGDEKRDRTVGYLLYILCDTLEQRVVNRAKFYKSAMLVKDGCVTISDKPAFGDLMDCPVDIDRRMLDYLVGLDSEFNEIVEGSHLYTPKVKLDQVILPEDHKALVMAAVSNFDAFTSAKKKYGLEDLVSYGAGLVLLFHGASGTGKTMLANAIANEVGKKLLLVNLTSLNSSAKGSGTGEMLKLIFREARLYDALIFFDECESFFESRTKSPLVTAMLAELERYSGLIILATNKAYVMDDAMHRRITLAIEFRNPDHTMRCDIWRKHIPSSIPLAPDVDFSTLSLDYELSGGLIKNAILSALSIAVSRRGPESGVLSMEDFIKGAKLQLRGYFQEDAAARKVIPKRSLGDCVFSGTIMDTLHEMVALEKGRKLLYSQWGFAEDEYTKQGLVALFSGPTGTGKSLAAEAIGYEIGMPLKVVNVAELGAKHTGDIASNVDKMFEDALKQNAILVLDDAERLFQSGGNNEDTSQLLAYHIARFPRIVIIAVRTESYLDTTNTPFSFNHRISFTHPTCADRAKMWKLSLPKQVPVDELVNFSELAERDLTGAQIKAAAFFACAKASLEMKTSKQIKPKLTTKHLEAAIEELKNASTSRTLASLFS